MPFRLLAQPIPAASGPIELRIRGGMPSEQLDFSFTWNADNSIAVRLLDRLSGRELATDARPPQKRLDVARNAILESGILAVEALLPPIPPDSAVGELLMVGARWVFMADVDQASVAGDPLPLQLVRAIGPLMALAKEALGIDTIQPALLADGAGPLFLASEDANVVLYNLRPAPLALGGFTLLNIEGGELQFPPGTTLEPHGILRVPMKEATMTTVVDANGAEVARRVHRSR